MENEQLNISELAEQRIVEKEQYEYLKVLNEKLTLFNKQVEITEKSDEEIEQTTRR